MKVLVSGASGFIGSRIFSGLRDAGHEVTGTYNNRYLPGLQQLDVRDEQGARNLIEQQSPDVVVHAVGIANVDICERDRLLASKVNVLGTRFVSEAAAKAGAKIIYLSSSYVFGSSPIPRRETDIPNPLNWYGITKFQAEQIVKENPRGAIIRFDLAYGYNGEGKPNGLVGTVLQAEEELALNKTQQRHLILIDDISLAIDRMIETDGSGIYHLGGPDIVSRHTLGTMLDQRLKKFPLYKPNYEYAESPKRPQVRLDTARAQRELGVKFTPLREAVNIIGEQIMMGRGLESPNLRRKEG